MKQKCQGINKFGLPCGRTVSGDFCLHHDPDHSRRCVAKKRNGERCGQPAVKNSTTCKKHLGRANARRGVFHHSHKHGRYAAGMGPDLAATYEQALKDSELLRLREEVSLVTARIDKMVERAEQNPVDLDAIADLCTALASAMADESWGAVGGVLSSLRQAAHSQRAEQKLWNSIESSVDLRRKLVESEHKRLDKLKMFVHVGEIQNMLGRILGVLSLRLPRDLFAEIGPDLGRVIDIRSTPVAPPEHIEQFLELETTDD